MQAEEKEKPKQCPFIVRTTIDIREGHREIQTEIHACLGEECALWVDIIKDTANPFYYGEYHGCGLVHVLPYRPIKRQL